MSCVLTYTDPNTGQTQEFETKAEAMAFLNNTTRDKNIEQLANELGQLDQTALSQAADKLKLLAGQQTQWGKFEELNKDIPEIYDSIKRLRNLDKQDLEDNVRQAQQIVAFLQNSSIVSEAVKSKAKELFNSDKTVEQKFTDGAALYEFAIGYEPVTQMIDELLASSNVTNNNEVYQLLSNVKNSLNYITKNYKDLQLSHVADWLFDAFGPTLTDSNNVEVSKRVERLEENLATAKKEGRKVDHIEKMISNLKKKVVTKDELRQTLLGFKGDVNFFSMMFEAAIFSGDPIVAGFQKKMSDKFTRLREQMIDDIQNPLFTLFSEFSKDKPKNNLRELNADLYQWVTRKVENKETGELEEVKEMWLNTEFDTAYLNEMTEREAQIKKARKEGDKEKTKALRQSYMEWKIQNLELPYTKEYYLHYESLSEDAMEARADIDHRIESLKGSYENLSDISEEVYIDLKKLFKEKALLGSEYDEFGAKKEGKALEIANEVRAWQEKRREMVSYEVTTESIRKFERARHNRETEFKRQVSDGKISQQEADRKMSMWDQQFSVVSLSPEFYQERKKILDKISALFQNSGERTLDDRWNEIFRLIGGASVRDDNRQIIPELIPEKGREKITSLQQEIEEAKFRKANEYGISKEEKNQYWDLVSKYALKDRETIDQWTESHQNSDEVELYSKVSEAIAREKQVTAAASYDMLDEYMKELAELYTTEHTTYYQMVYNQQKNLVANTLAQDAGNETNEDFENRIQREFEKSKWYRDNHFYKHVYNKDSHRFETIAEPSYVWTVVVPKNPIHINREPGFSFRETKVKEDYLNPTAKENTILNRPYPKPHLMNRNYPTNPESQKALKSLTEFHLKHQEKLDGATKLGYRVPSLEKTFQERVVDGDSEGKDRGLGALRSIKRSFTLNENDHSEGGWGLGDIEGNPFEYIPVNYREKIDPNDQSYNVWGAVAHYAGASMRAQMLKETLNEAQALKRILNDNTPFSDTKDSFAKALGIDRFLKSDTNNRLRQIDELIRTIFYGENRKAEGYFKEVVKGFDTLSGITATSVLAWNIPSAVTNFMSAQIQTVIEASAGRYLNMKDYASGNRIYMRHAHEVLKSFGKEGNKPDFVQMVEYWGAIQGEFEEEFGQKYDHTAGKEATSMRPGYYLRKAGEHEVQTSLWIAMMNKNTVMVDGKQMSLFEAYSKLKKEQGKLSIRENEGLIKKAKLVDGKWEEDGDWTYKDELALMTKIQSVNISINGNYNKFNRAIIEKYALGRALFFLKRYFPSMFTKRFGNFRSNVGLDDYTEGFYRTFFRLTLQDSLNYLYGKVTGKASGFSNNRALYKALFTKEKGALTPMELANFRRAGAEISLVIILWMLIGLIGDDPADYEDKSFITLHTLYQLKKLRSETEQFIPLPGVGINEWYRTLGTPSIAFNSGKKWFKLLDHTANLVFGDEDQAYYQKDAGFWKEGDPKAIADALSIIGFTGKTFYPEELLKSYNFAQRNQ